MEQETPKNPFARHYYSVMSEAMHLSRMIQGKADKVRAIESFNHPALHELKELIDKYYNFARHTYFFFAKSLEIDFPDKTIDEIEDLIAISLVETEAEIAENLKQQPRQQTKNLTPQEMQKRAFAAYMKLLKIHRDISTNAKMVKISATQRMNNAHSALLYMAVENYAASKGKVIIPAEEVFPALKDSIEQTKRMRLTNVVEVEFISSLTDKLKATTDVIKSMSVIFGDNFGNINPVSWASKIKADANKSNELA